MDNEPIKILLIEDNPADVRLLQEMLTEAKDFSYSLECADRLSAGLSSLYRGGIDVVLLDLSLPDSQGLHTFDQVYAQAPYVPVIIMTITGDEETAVKAVQKGAQDYLFKGQVNGNCLVRSIRYAIERKRTEEELMQYRSHLEELVQERTAQLTTANEQLQGEIIKRKGVEESLRAEQQRLFTLLDGLPGFVYLQAPDYSIRFANRYFREHFGSNQEGRPCYEILKRCKGPGRCEECPTYRVFDTKSPQQWEWIGPDGRVYEIYDYPFTDIDGSPLVLELGVDITDRKKMEEELLKAQKLESLGVLAGGIAHDFNNILVAIMGSFSLLRFVKSEDKFFEVLSKAEKAANRAKDLTRQLLTFSKGEPFITKTSSISELLKDTTSFCLRGSKVKHEFCLSNNLWPVEIDEGQISQVINNLIINADQAMPDGGIIRISTENVRIRANEGLPLKEGKYVKISIKDQGIGISEEDLHKIFDPYFTTKSDGSGLGLAISYSIVNKHKGYIMAESKVGVETTFILFLPASEKEIFLVEKVVEEKLCFGQGKILVMDDDPDVRDTAGQMLTRLGYVVEFAKDGAEAIKLYKKAKESGQGFEAVISDLTIPGGMGAEEVIKKLHETDPEVKVIISSGYSNDRLITEYRQYGFTGVITKPYEIRGLGETLSEVIRGAEKLKISHIPSN